MRIYHFALVFIVFSVGAIAVADMKVAEDTYIEGVRLKLDAYLESAVNSAAWELKDLRGVLNEESADRAVAAFYNSLFGSLGIMDIPDKRTVLYDYVPALLINTEDGCYLINYVLDSDLGIAVTGFEKIKEENRQGEGVSFAAFFTGYPIAGGIYDGYRVSASRVKER